MDYSQFLIMRGEISLLLVFLLIFLFDTFGGKKEPQRIIHYGMRFIRPAYGLEYNTGRFCYGVRGYVSDFSHSFDG